MHEDGLLPTEQDIDFYWSHGYWVAPVIFDKERIDKVRQAMRRIYSGDLERDGAWPYVPIINEENPSSIKSGLHARCVNDVIYDLVVDSTLAEIAARLMRVDRVRVWQDQAILKPGSKKNSSAGNIGYHQDYVYWQDSSTTNMISANVALQDTTIKNGALRVFDGSHKIGMIDGDFSFFDTDLEALHERLSSQFGVDKETIIDLKAGQVSFHHSLTVHGSGENRSSEPRMVIAPGYMPDGTYYRDEGQESSPHSDFLGNEKKHGRVYDGNYFPLVYPGNPLRGGHS